MPNANEKIILVDWGNTNLRFYLKGREPGFERRAMAEGGIQQLKLFRRTEKPQAELYAETLAGQIGDWLEAYPDAPVLMGGVIGTREGWSVAPYFPCPANAGVLAKNLYRIPDPHLGVLKGRRVYIVPGLKVLHEGERRYVMRGEEIKAFGALSILSDSQEHVLHMPGTHCQWLHMKGHEIDRFWTFLAGELYDIMIKHGSLASFLPAEEPEDLPSFDRGITLAAQGRDLLTDLHNVRAQGMTGDNPPRSFRHYISGIMIGHEITGAAKVFGTEVPVTLVADAGPKKELYRRAYAQLGWKIERELLAEDLLLAGLERICLELPAA